MIRILKASAGSGKTYRLAQTYLNLLRERYAYRHILAVTFTNKATAEMKERILRELARKAKVDAGAREMLIDILHDYSAFSVSTIDRFFQQALRAFSRELGHFSAYQIELKRELLLDEAMDRILDSLSEDQTDILNWMRRYVSDCLAQGIPVRLDAELHEMGRRLGQEEFRERAERLGIDRRQTFSKERLAALREECDRIVARFEEEFPKAANEVLPSLSEAHQKYIAPYLAPPEKGRHFGAITQKRLRDAIEGSRFGTLYEKEFPAYRTALLLRDMSFSLGLAGEFFKELDALLQEKNVMSLDDSNTLLRDIIDGSDAPFIYEKLGVRYEHFLLDEFQDTARIQWENFYPLLRESHASGHENLVVGDVKQSIYRFRGSDWTLLSEELPAAFPDADVEVMGRNWRSCRNIVDFNNRFFRETARALDFERLFADVHQEVCTKDTQEGFVRVSFCPKEEMGERVLDSIADARAAGAGYGDIAILVRNNKDGGTLALQLIGQGIPVVSDDSLQVKSSRTVRRLVALLSSLDSDSRDGISGYLTESLGIEIPERYSSLTELCAQLLRGLRACDPECFEGEALFIQAFLDELQQFLENRGGGLRDFLLYWKENNATISSPRVEDAVRVITIHKAKGLQFPYVIFPHADKVSLYYGRNNWHWCTLKTEGTPFSAQAAGLYPIQLSSTTGPQTLFNQDFEEDRRLQAADNLNIFYVALTRAEKCLHILAEDPPKTLSMKDLSQYLYKFCGQTSDFCLGSMYDFTKMKRPAAEEERELSAAFESIPLGGRLTPGEENDDFFAPDAQGSVEARREGLILHGILEQVQTADDLRRAVDEAVLDGLLDAQQGEKAYDLLSRGIAAHPDWFSGASRNEATVIDGRDGSEHRPDRVVFTPGGDVLIIDYKFGQEEEGRYRRQITRYMDLYRRMGYTSVQGYLWYVREDRVISLSLQ
ncbi:MAG: UvrD-helicase domain-containing protein [Bacteroidales bacterium]|nr:UvrD-helicase domain-containing protein [Bacteroidales bacterium]